jgi:predicted phosphodiesterase
MKIQIVSDLHLEFSDINIKNENNADVLILSGDIMVATDLYDHPAPSTPYLSNEIEPGTRKDRARIYRDFLKRCSFQFPHVIYVMGNHEFYGGRWFDSVQWLRDECSRFPNVYFLEREGKDIDGVRFLGCTLWTDMNKHDPMTLHAVRDMMMDYRKIRNDKAGFTSLKPADTAQRHKDSLGYLKFCLEGKADFKHVVVTHHSPSFKSCHPQYASDYLMNGAYHSDLSEFIMDHPQIKLWTHGHTHHPFDYVIGETRVVCNPRGYEADGYSEDTGWNPNMIVEV